MTPDFGKLSYREILILTCRETIKNSELLEAHSKQIKSLEVWRNWTSGAIAAIAALIGISRR